MKIALLGFIGAIFGLVGCASEPEDTTYDPYRAQRAQAAMMMWQGVNQQNEAIQQRNNNIMQNYQNSIQQNRRSNTNCTTNMVGTTAYTNCSGN